MLCLNGCVGWILIFGLILSCFLYYFVNLEFLIGVLFVIL